MVRTSRPTGYLAPSIVSVTGPMLGEPVDFRELTKLCNNILRCGH
jgi:hypothetical protein